MLSKNYCKLESQQMLANIPIGINIYTNWDSGYKAFVYTVQIVYKYYLFLISFVNSFINGKKIFWFKYILYHASESYQRIRFKMVKRFFINRLDLNYEKNIKYTTGIYIYTVYIFYGNKSEHYNAMVSH